MSGPAPAAFGRFRLVLIGLFAAQAVWTAASVLWASSLSNTWEEVNRTLFYAVGLALAMVGVRWIGRLGLRVLAALVMATIGVMGVFLAVRLGTSDDPSRYFASGRLQYPVSYFNALAALLVIGFWLAMGMANGFGGKTRDRGRAIALRALQPLLLGLSVFLLELALLPQSRGAFWTLFFVVPFFVIFSTNRFRALADLAIVALPVAIFWSRLNGAYAALHAKQLIEPALGRALVAMGYSVLIVFAAWAVTWLVERGIGPLSRRLRFWIGIALIVVAVGGVAGGTVYADQRTGGLNHYISTRWAELTSDRSTGGEAETRFTALGLNGRVRMWEVAVHAFEDHPILGLGAQNYEFYYYLHRVDTIEVKQPHSQPLQLLAELGFPGLLLWLAFFFGTVVTALVVRFRSADRMEQAVVAATVTAVLSWFIHSAPDWLWQVTSLSLPAMVLLGGLLATGPLRRRESRPTRRSWMVRSVLALLAVVVLISAALPYLSIRYDRLVAGTRDLPLAVARAHTASALDPTSVLPFASLANVYKLAADREPAASPARVSQLKLAAETWVEATKHEPAGWLGYYQAAQMYVLARDAAVAVGDPSSAEFAASALTYLDQAKRLNPLSPQVKTLETAL